MVVKARVVSLNPQRRGARGPKMHATMSRAVDAHLRYLERDGVTRDSERGKAYSAFENEAGKGSAGGKIAISFASSCRPRMQPRWLIERIAAAFSSSATTA